MSRPSFSFKWYLCPYVVPTMVLAFLINAGPKLTRGMRNHVHFSRALHSISSTCSCHSISPSQPLYQLSEFQSSWVSTCNKFQFPTERGGCNQLTLNVVWSQLTCRYIYILAVARYTLKMSTLCSFFLFNSKLHMHLMMTELVYSCNLYTKYIW